MYSIFVCAAYLVVGLFLIMLNQHILKALHFPYPMFLSGLGILMSGLVSYFIILAGFVSIQKKDQVSGRLWYIRVLPIGLASATTLSFGNMAYLSLNIGFIQMLKTLTPVVIMLCAVILKVQTPSIWVVYSVVVISLGTAMTCTFTPDASPIGLLIMFISMLSEAIKLVLTQFMLQQLKFGVVEGQYILAPACAFWLFLASLVFEYPDMQKRGAFQILIDHGSFFFAASALGVMVNFLSYAVIQCTNSLTMKILGTFRNIVTIAIGVLVYKEVITFYEGLGYVIALLGFVCYNLSEMGYFERMKVTIEKKDETEIIDDNANEVRSSAEMA